MTLYAPAAFDLRASTTFDAWDRRNLVRIDTLKTPGDPYAPCDRPELPLLAEKIRQARAKGRPVVMFFGAHVIKCGLSRYIIELIQRKVITHIASNGAGSIHDFELAYLGGTSEDVPTAIEDGSFGMWEQTGRWMNEALREGAAKGLGYGEALAHHVQAQPDRFPHRQDCVFYNAYANGVAATYHVTLGADIIHEHPAVDFSALGSTSGRDFAYFVEALKELEGGVFMNFGSAVTGPEVFLKALSIVRNNGYIARHITTANFDIIPLGDYKGKINSDHFHYYYRPRKNIVNRPVSMGGHGYYIEGDHNQTIPTLHHLLADC